MNQGRDGGGDQSIEVERVEKKDRHRVPTPSSSDS
jgi:hypothetical protein